MTPQEVIRLLTADALRHLAELDAKDAEWAGWGVIEVAVRNSSVSDYMEHWEGRALKAEAAGGEARRDRARARGGCLREMAIQSRQETP